MGGLPIELLRYVDIDENEWQDYVKIMITYRDKHIAHYDIDAERESPYYPKFDIALKSVCFYYNWLMKGESVEVLEESVGIRLFSSNGSQDFMNYYKKFEEQNRQIAQIAYLSTEHIQDLVG